MTDLRVAAIQTDARVGEVEFNLAHATELVGQAATQGAQLVVLPELFSTGYEYTDSNLYLPEPLSGLSGTWIVETADRLGIHLVGSFPAKIEGKAYIVAMLASPDGKQWVYRKKHVALWENLYFERGSEPMIANTELGRIGIMICWDQVFTDLARAYQGRVDLLCIPSSSPSWVGTMEGNEGRALGRLGRQCTLGRRIDGVDWFERAQVAHTRSAGVPLIYASRSGEFHSTIPYGWPLLTTLKPTEAIHVLRSIGTKYTFRCPMQGHSCILDARGQTLIVTGQASEEVLVANVQLGAPGLASEPQLPTGRALIPGIPRFVLLLDDSLFAQGWWYRQRHSKEPVASLRVPRSLLRIAFVLLILAIFTALLQLMYPVGVDWRYTFSRVDEYWRDPYVIGAFTSPPWLIPLLPHAWLPTDWGNTINFALNTLVILAVVRRYKGGWQTLLLIFTSPLFFDLARTNNVDWIPLLSVLIPPMWGLPLLAVKPHTIGGIALVWWKQRRFRPSMLAPFVIVLSLSLVFYGIWFLNLKQVENTMWNFAPWPYGIPLGMYMLYRAYRSEDEILAAASTPFLTPYIAPYSLTIVLALVGCKYRREAFLVYAGFWIYFVVEARRMALM